MKPSYDLDKIKFATDAPTFEKTADLYESGKVTHFKEGIGAYLAVVQGSKPYRVSVGARRYDYGRCECYLGQNDTLCPSTPERTTSTPVVSPAPNDDLCLIKGNISSLGEKIYHLPGCGSYSKTMIEKSRGERWFCTEAEAQATGWRKALNCP